jgi:hypothetical protein
VVTWADSFDWNLGHQLSSVMRPAGIQAAPRLGTSSRADLIEITRAGDQIVMTRSSAMGTNAFVVRGSDFAPVRSFDEMTISGGGRGTPAPVSVAESAGVVAILTAFDRGAPSLALLACGAI